MRYILDRRMEKSKYLLTIKIDVYIEIPLKRLYEK